MHGLGSARPDVATFQLHGVSKFRGVCSFNLQRERTQIKEDIQLPYLSILSRFSKLSHYSPPPQPSQPTTTTCVLSPLSNHLLQISAAAPQLHPSPAPPHPAPPLLERVYHFTRSTCACASAVVPPNPTAHILSALSSPSSQCSLKHAAA